MTRRGLFKMLAATPLAGILAKFAPKPAVKRPTMSEWKKAASILDDIDKRFSSTDKYFKPNRANIQS